MTPTRTNNYANQWQTEFPVTITYRCGGSSFHLDAEFVEDQTIAADLMCALNSPCIVPRAMRMVNAVCIRFLRKWCAFISYSSTDSVVVVDGVLHNMSHLDIYQMGLKIEYVTVMQPDHDSEMKWNKQAQSDSTLLYLRTFEISHCHGASRRNIGKSFHVVAKRTDERTRYMHIALRNWFQL